MAKKTTKKKEEDEDLVLDDFDDDEEEEEDLDEIEDEMLAEDEGDSRSGDEVLDMLRSLECDPCTRSYSKRLSCKVRKEYGCPEGKWND